MNLFNCVGARELNTSAMQHYAIMICTTDANRPEKKDQVDKLSINVYSYAMVSNYSQYLNDIQVNTYV